MNTTPVPHDTSTRLQPNPWVRMGITGIKNPRPAEADDHGRVDFDTTNGDTHVTAYATVGPERTTMHVLPQVEPLDVVVYDANHQKATTVSVHSNGGVTVTDRTTPQASTTAISVTLAIEVTDDDVDMIMDTALSGIAYWAADVTEDGNGTWVLTDRVFNDGALYTITRASVRLALQRAASIGYQALDIGPDVHNTAQAAMQAEDFDTVDVGEIDASAADQLVQVAAFGRVVYA